MSGSEQQALSPSLTPSFPQSLAATFVAAGHGGSTAPPEMIIFMPSATVISSSTTSCRGTMRTKPLVGFGLVGTNTVHVSLLTVLCASPCALLVRKPSVHAPLRGNSTRTTLLKVFFCEPNVATICFTEL